MNAAETIQTSPTRSPSFEATEPALPAAQHWPTVPGCAGAIVLFAIGFVILARVRREVRADDLKASSPGNGWSASTRILTAISCLIGAYHLCAWSLDERLLPLRVPAASWWVVPVIAVLAIAASGGVDLVLRRFDADARAK